MPQIRVISGLDQPGVIPLEEREIIIGRDPSCDLVLHPEIARVAPARLDVPGRGWLARPRPGQFQRHVAQRRRRSRISLLAPGDQVTLATLKFVYEADLDGAVGGVARHRPRRADRSAAPDASPRERALPPTHASRRWSAP